MKPLRIDYTDLDGTDRAIFVLPTTINEVRRVDDKTLVHFDDRCYHIDEPLLDFVARWEEALADHTPIYIVDPPKESGKYLYR